MIVQVVVYSVILAVGITIGGKCRRSARRRRGSFLRAIPTISWIFIGFGIIGIGAAAYLACLDFPSSASESVATDAWERAAQQGDFWGGHIGGISAAAGLMFTAAAIFMQSKELAEQIEEMRETKVAAKCQARQTALLTKATLHSNRLLAIQAQIQLREKRQAIGAQLKVAMNLLEPINTTEEPTSKILNAMTLARQANFYGAPAALLGTIEQACNLRPKLSAKQSLVKGRNEELQSAKSSFNDLVTRIHELINGELHLLAVDEIDREHLT